MKTMFSRLGLFLWLAMVPCFSSRALTTLYSFTNRADSSHPYAGLALGGDGNFYGTCAGDFSSDFGSVFQLTPGGALTTLHSFSYGDGAAPTAALALGSDGNFYGATSEGGSNLYYGTVFQISSAGAFNSLYSFTNGVDGANPQAGVIEGLNGGFYGATAGGGTYGHGSLYEVTSGGAFYPLYSFFGGSDGSQPRTALTLAGDGSFYGTTYTGGASNGQGVVFHLTSTLAFKVLYTFTNGTDGANPLGQLLLTNGVLYGTASGGGKGYGTIFKLTTAGAFTAMYSFTNGADGGDPEAGLALGNDGNFYGTTHAGGFDGNGSIFKITPQGAFSSLYDFTGGSDGSGSDARLVQGNDGSFYGTTQNGGGDGDGVAFSINVFSTAPTITAITRAAGTIEITWSAIPGQVYQAQYATNLTQTAWSNLGGQVTATNGVCSQTDSAPNGPARFYRVYLAP